MKACQSGDTQACAQKTKELVAYEKMMDEENIDAEYPQYNLGGYSLLGIDKALGKQLMSVSNIGKDATGVVKNFVMKRNSREGAVKSVLDTGGAALAGAAVVGGCVATGVIPCVIGASVGGLAAFDSVNYLYGDVQQAWRGKLHPTALISTAKWFGASSSDANLYQQYVDRATAGTAVLDFGVGAVSVASDSVRLVNSADRMGSSAEELSDAARLSKNSNDLNWKAWYRDRKQNPDAVPDMSVSSSGRQESGQNADTLLLTPTRESVRRDLNNLPDGQGENHTVRQLSNGKFTTVRKDINLSQKINVTDEGNLFTPLKRGKGWQSATEELKYPGIERLPKGTVPLENDVTKTAGGFVSGQSYTSFSALKRELGPAGNNRAWHHIVEQTPENVKKFGTELIQNTGNVVNIPHGKGLLHQKISGFYSSKQPFTNGQTVRQWISTKSFDEQYEFGIKIMNQFKGQQ